MYFAYRCILQQKKNYENLKVLNILLMIIISLFFFEQIDYHITKIYISNSKYELYFIPEY